MNNKPLKILFLSNVPSPYRVEFFNELGSLCDLTVLYQLHASAERDKQWTARAGSHYRQVFLSGKATAVDQSLCPGVVRWLKRSWDVIVIHGNSSPTELLAIAWCKGLGIPYCLEGDGAFVGAGSRLKEGLKAFAVTGASRYFSTCQELDRYYIHYGAPAERICRYPFSSLTEADILPQAPTQAEKQRLRRELRMTDKRVLLSIGQFIPRKGIDLLLEAALALSRDVGLYIIGGTPTPEYRRFVEENHLANVHFVGFQTKDSLGRYYQAADLFVLPTREDIWGLVVQEAMAYGLGVISTNRCNAGLELIRGGKNGYLVPVEDVAALAQAITQALPQAEALGAQALETIRPYTVQSMAQRHLRLFQEARKGQ